MAHDQDFVIFSGSANAKLADAVARQLETRPGAAEVERFPDGEVSVRLLEPVRHKEVLIVQSTGPPVDPNLFELLCWADACRRAGAARVTGVVPYFGYSRSEKRHGRREPITASLVAQVMESAGFDHLITVDLHSAQSEGFFKIPVECLTAVPLLCAAARELLPPDSVVVSPDLGRLRTATEVARLLGLPAAVLHKHRESGSEVHVTKVVGDVRGRSCLVIDDMIVTGGTIAEGVKALLRAGARAEVIVTATHGPLLDAARERMSDAAIVQVLVTDTIVPGVSDWPKLRVVSVAPAIARAIRGLVA